MPTLKHDIEFDIAIGKNRNAKSWKNTKILWSELIARISKTHRTVETYEDYLSAPKQRQDEIKDVGGFVGGYLVNGRRKKDAVLHRQLLTLDIDFAASNTFDDFTLLYDNAAAIYSTHKHSEATPRYRLLIPLNREVFPDEYIAIGRKVAGSLGIENFDNTTFAPERLMYWPSTAKNGRFYSDFQDGAILDADEILNLYDDWKDATQWPVSQRYSKAILTAIKKQGDPLEKPGIVGAFCRTFDIHETIEKYLSDIYEACDVPDRYTYKDGSTTGGLVIYDDKFAYSHHGTDPTSGKLCNAFDLVRIHYFGLKDEDVKSDVPINKTPSFLHMAELVLSNKDVKERMGVEKLESAGVDFAQDPDAPESTEWLTKMDVDIKGNFLNTINNVVLILDNDPKLKGRFAFDEFEHREIAIDALPWRSIKNNRYLEDKDDSSLRHYLENVYKIYGVQKTKDALDVVTAANSFHPVRDYLDELTWDGEARIDTLFVDYLGAEDTPFVRAATRKVLCAAVARIYRPGIKFDYVPVLVGEQGLKKSMLIDKLGRQWFSDSFTTVQGKEAFEQLQGVWIVEIAELAGLKKAELETIKHFITKREDRYRVAYGVRIANFPRQCVFLASTNTDDFLKDHTGNRRFWPIRIGQQERIKDPAAIKDKEISQIWAEALYYYNEDEPLFLSEELEAAAALVQSEHRETDEREGLIRAFLDMPLPEEWYKMSIYERRAYIQSEETREAGTEIRKRVCVPEIWCELFGGQIKDLNVRNAKEIHTMLRNIKNVYPMKSKSRFKNYDTQRGYTVLPISKLLATVKRSSGVDFSGNAANAAD